MLNNNKISKLLKEKGEVLCVTFTIDNILICFFLIFTNIFYGFHS